MLVKSYSLKKALWVIMAGLSCMVSGHAAACQLETSGAPTAPRIEYDVYGFDTAIASTNFELRNAGETECILDIVAKDLASFPPPFDFGEAGVLIDVIAPGLQRPQNSQNIEGIFALTLGPGAARTVQLDFTAQQNISVPAGLYNRDITIGVRSYETSELLEEWITDLSLFSSSQAQVNIAGTSGNFNKDVYADTIDFGEAELGETRRVFVQARSNSYATMTIRSDNNGKMKHSNQADATIGYSAVLDNQTLDLSTPFVLPGLNATDLNGISQPLDLTIDSLNNPYAGQYSDRIVIEIEAR